MNAPNMPPHGTIECVFKADLKNNVIICKRFTNSPKNRHLTYGRFSIHPVRSYLSPKALKSWDNARKELGWPIQKAP